MSTVELVVTETRVWARSAVTHWDGPPSIVLGSNGFDLVVGESLTPPTQVSSVVQHVSAEAVALLPRIPSVADGMAAVLSTAMENLRVAAPCERVTVICPTEWGSARRAVLEQAARRWTGEVRFEELAVRAVAADDGTSHSRRTLVLEFGTLTTTAATVLRSHEGVRLESCAHEPNLALAEVLPASRGFDELVTVISRLLDGQQVELAQVVGLADQTKIEVLRAAVQQSCGPGVDLRSIAGPELIRGKQTEPIPVPESAPVGPPPDWMQPLRERAAAQQPRRRGTAYVGVAVAAVVVVAAAVVGGVLLLNRSADTTTAAPTTMLPPSGPTVGPPPPFGAPPPPGGEPEVFGRVRFQVPDGWHLAAPPDATGRARVELSPDDGARMRIIVTQTQVAFGAGYEQVASNLEAQIGQRPPGVLTDLKRDVVFGGRSGLAYRERPGDGSTVNWHVLLEYGIQLSIGCQYVGDGWSALSTTCDRFGGSVRVVP
ncbi:type VII secretion-associated protein [Nocardia brasiliensis]|uniref:type VII secretion-associated protein n=1 Tax=Nocardia brasiliensis TaxID=37326 RepID=UPI0004A6B4C4|nr:type VII secretion-associated protein [Nocardia brasiliensis]